MPYIVQTEIEGITIPETELRELGDGVYQFVFERGLFGSESVAIDTFQVGSLIHLEGQTLKVLSVKQPNNDTLLVEVAVITGLVTVVGIVSVLIAGGFLFGMIGWSLKQVNKLFGLEGSPEPCVDASGNVVACSGFLDKIRGLFGATSGLILFGSLAYFVYRKFRHE